MADYLQQRIARQLDLLLAMTDGTSHTSADLCEILGTSQRNLYYFFEQLRNYGFLVVKDRRAYYLDPRSPFFRKLVSNVRFSDEEAAYLYKLTEATGTKNALTESIENKLRRSYDIRFVTDKQLQSRHVRNVSRLYDAMDRHRVVVLKNYSSPHSHTVSDRYVEPFLFMNEQNDLRCYELSTGMNKTFKLSRIEDVVVLEDLLWSNEDDHRAAFTDLFLFSGEEKHRVRLRLGQLSAHLLSEEYPKAAPQVKADGPGRWLFETDVVSYAGIGRFILGLADDIEVLDDDGLRHYLQQKAAQLASRAF